MTPLDAALANIDEYIHLNRAYPGAEIIRARCRAMMRAYAIRWADDIDEYEVLGVEELQLGPIINPTTLKETDYTAAGLIDVRAKQRKTGKRVIIDHKFLRTEMDDEQHEHLLIDTQPIHYALLEHLNGERVESAIWDVVAKTLHRPYTQKGRQETPEMFEERVFGIYAESPSKYFARLEIPILKYNLSQYSVELHEWTKNIDSSRKTGQHLKTPESCFLYGRACRYLGICSGRTEVLQGLQEGSLVKVAAVHPELTLPSGYDPRMTITNSRLKTFRACMYKHDLQFNLGIRKANEIAEESLFVGACGHKAQEGWWGRIREMQAV